MFCQFCGGELKAGVNYCNRCGAETGQPGAVERPPGAAPVSLTRAAWAVGVTTAVTIIGGLLALFVGLAGLASWSVPPAQLGVIAVVGLLTIFGAEALLLRQLPRLANIFRGEVGRAPSRQSIPERPAPAQLYERFEPISSVTDHTTYRLDAGRKQPERSE